MNVLALIAALSAGPVIDQGALPSGPYPDLTEKASEVWAYVQSATGISPTVAAPRVFLYPFEAGAGSDEFRSFRDAWIADHPEIWVDWQAANPGRQRQPGDFPFPAGFMGFYYTGTGSIELSPADFTRYLFQDPDGVARDHSGVGYYNLGHEFHHYALEILGVPIRIHHCVFLLARKSAPTSLMEALANHLEDSGTSSFLAKLRGYQIEVSFDPCSALSDDERKQAQGWAAKL